MPQNLIVHKTILKTATFSENLSKKTGEDDGGDDGIIFPEHPSPILHAPRDNISRRGNPSLRPVQQLVTKCNGWPSSIVLCRSEGLPLRDMLSLGAWRMGLGCSGKIIPPSPPSSPSSSPKGSATFWINAN